MTDGDPAGDAETTPNDRATPNDRSSSDVTARKTGRDARRRLRGEGGETFLRGEFDDATLEATIDRPDRDGYEEVYVVPDPDPGSTRYRIFVLTGDARLHHVAAFDVAALEDDTRACGLGRERE